MEPHQYPNPRVHGPHQMKMSIQPTQQHPDNDLSSAELRALDCNLTSLCDHIQLEGFNSGSFSDIVVHTMGSTYHLHRLILSRSSYFRNMLHGPWKEASSPIVTLNVDDKNVNAEAIAMALAYLYGHHPKLNDNNAFRVLAAASFLDLQDLCAICTDFIISELWTSNFLEYQMFAENQDYGIYGERVRNACWGYLCQSGAVELKEVLPKLSSQTLLTLLTSDELWVPSEEKRFELAVYTLLAKGAFCRTENSDQGNSSSGMLTGMHLKGKNLSGICLDKTLESELGDLSLKDNSEGHDTASNLLGELVDCMDDLQTGAPSSEQQGRPVACTQTNAGTVLSSNSLSEMNGNRISCSYLEMPIISRKSEHDTNGVAVEGPSEEGSYHLNSNSWLVGDESRHYGTVNTSCSGLQLNDWGGCSATPLSWGGRIVGRRQVKGHALGNSGVREEDYDTFVNIFEGCTLLYCNMSFEELLNVRKQLEELGFPCKAVNDGLWLQMLLSQKVLEIGADTCRSCSFTSMACTCRQPLVLSHGVTTTAYYLQEHEHSHSPASLGDVYVADTARGEGNGVFRPVRLHVRGPVDGLAGIGRGATSVQTAGWHPTRFVFSRVPFNVGSRNGQQSVGNDDTESRTDLYGDPSGGGLTALVGLSQGWSNTSNVHGEHVERGYESDMQGRSCRPSDAASSGSSIAVPMMDSPDHSTGIEWDNTDGSFISLDMKTPLSHFPPFRFGVEFDGVHRLSDGQVKHSPEFFYAGSLWKVSVQAFNDEDPQGRRTLGLFLHRRKGEISDSIRKVHMYVDSREKVTARYQLICPSKRHSFAKSFKQRGTLLPKAPKGWGWRTALLFDELAELLQNGTLRVAAVVQLV